MRLGFSCGAIVALVVQHQRWIKAIETVFI
jgi:hypothetical protein